jgi:hypothetical protein
MPVGTLSNFVSDIKLWDEEMARCRDGEMLWMSRKSSLLLFPSRSNCRFTIFRGEWVEKGLD